MGGGGANRPLDGMIAGLFLGIHHHRLLKAVIKGETIARPGDDTTVQMAERRRLNRMAERDVGDWLYARFLSDKAGTDTRFAAEIIDVYSGAIPACCS